MIQQKNINFTVLSLLTPQLFSNALHFQMYQLTIAVCIAGTRLFSVADNILYRNHQCAYSHRDYTNLNAPQSIVSRCHHH